MFLAGLLSASISFLAVSRIANNSQLPRESDSQISRSAPGTLMSDQSNLACKLLALLAASCKLKRARRWRRILPLSCQATWPFGHTKQLIKWWKHWRVAGTKRPQGGGARRRRVLVGQAAAQKCWHAGLKAAGEPWQTHVLWVYNAMRELRERQPLTKSETSSGAEMWGTVSGAIKYLSVQEVHWEMWWTFCQRICLIKRTKTWNLEPK